MPPFWKKNRKSSQPEVPESSTAARRQSTQPAQPVQSAQPVQPPTTPLPLRVKPENPFRKSGDDYSRQGNYDGAVYMYMEALKQDTHDVLLVLQLAFARTMCREPQLNEALEDVNRAIQLEPSSGQAWQMKGNVHSRLGDMNAAEGALEQAMSLLHGWELLQVQQSLADVRLKKSNMSSIAANPPVTTPPPTSPSVQPIQPQVTSTGPLQPTQSQISTPRKPVASSQPTHQTQTVNVSSVDSPSINIPSASSPPPSTPQIVVNTPPPPPVPAPAPAPIQSTATSPTANPGALSPTLNQPARSAAGFTSPTTPSTQPRATTPSMYSQGEVLAHQLDIPTEAPPSYTPAAPLSLFSNTAVPATTRDNLADFEAAITAKRQGSLYLRPWTMDGQIDSVQLLFLGKNYLESVVLDLPLHLTLHASWKKYHVSVITHPGNNFLDYDCESTSSYEGRHCGTTTVLGYAEEYREHQLALVPMLQLTLEAATAPPAGDITTIVSRIQLLQSNPTLEDNAGLDRFLSLPPAIFGVTTKQMVEDICMVYNRGSTDEPGRFIDFLKVESFSVHLFGAGIGLKNFLFLILMGTELVIRLIKLGSVQKYTNVMRTSTSALVVIATQWMENVTIRWLPTGKYVLAPNSHALQCEGLMKFAETIGWPYLAEARTEVGSLFTKMVANPANVHNYLKDWLYGLVLPGKFFRHRIMSCLLLASPTTKHLGFAPYYDSGLVVGDKSYWPKRTVLGRVLGGLRNVKSTCGWIGPALAPVACPTSWILLYTRHVDFVTPVVDDLSQTNLEILGFSETDSALNPLGVAQEIANISKWKPPAKLPDHPAGTDSTPVRLSTIRLTEVAVPGSSVRYHRARLEFTCQGGPVTSLTLHTNPVFVHVPSCVGSEHPIHDRQVQKLLRNVVLAKNLRSSTTWATDQIMIIDATGEADEEAMARAWCAEKGRHAVVRKGGVGCFTCATNVTAKRTGLGFNVLIWCS